MDRGVARPGTYGRAPDVTVPQYATLRVRYLLNLIDKQSPDGGVAAPLPSFDLGGPLETWKRLPRTSRIRRVT